MIIINMEDNYSSPESIEQLVKEGRYLLTKRRSSLSLSTEIHFASFPTDRVEPTNTPYILPWYVRRNIEALAPKESI
jgi:hypothetical protein